MNNEQNDLLTAVLNDDSNRVKALWSQAIDNNVAVNSSELLMAAIGQGNLDLTNFFLSVGADPNYENIFGFTPLLFATRDSERLLYPVIDWKIVPESHRIEITKSLIAGGADVNKANCFKVTPLLSVCQNDSDYLELTKTLIAAGARVTPRNLANAIWYNKPNLADLFVKAGADITSKDAKSLGFFSGIDFDELESQKKMENFYYQKFESDYQTFAKTKILAEVYFNIQAKNTLNQEIIEDLSTNVAKFAPPHKTDNEMHAELVNNLNLIKLKINEARLAAIKNKYQLTDDDLASPSIGKQLDSCITSLAAVSTQTDNVTKSQQPIELVQSATEIRQRLVEIEKEKQQQADKLKNLEAAEQNRKAARAQKRQALQKINRQAAEEEQKQQAEAAKRKAKAEASRQKSKPQMAFS